MATNESGEFETSLKRLEEIVAKLEKDNPSLDDSVALFREGRVLAKKCETLLKAAQTSIEAAQKDVDVPAAAPARGRTTTTLFGNGDSGDVPF